ncbi:uncharacterized protein [Solanum lycopersicum]|uniref:uncharacterized protein n=1 Tax=Solanum lycopersicum TaxID=4081 RepID=UPI00374872B2
MAAVAEGASGSCLWHNRLGHISIKGMKMLVAKGELEGLKFVDMGLCESCVMGKQKRVSFTKIPREPKKVRSEMIHTDVWGPSPVEDSIKWEQAMDDEMRSLEKNDTWVLTELSTGKRDFLNKWVFRIKTESDGKRRFKARLVVKGYSQRKAIDYAKIFSHVVKDLYAATGRICGSWQGTHGLQAHQKLVWTKESTKAVGFVDADLGGDVDSSKSSSGYIYTIGGTVVSWMSRLQKCVSLSSTEAEYMAIAEAGKELIWLEDYLEELARSRARTFFTQIARVPYSW